MCSLHKYFDLIRRGSCCVTLNRQCHFWRSKSLQKLMLSQVVDKNRGCLGQKCRGVYWGLHEAPGENELRFRTVARLIKAFCAGPNNTVDLHCKGRTYNSKDKIDIENGIFSMDRRWTLRELSVDLVSGADAVCTMTFLCYH